jgi:hypothetical protein
VYVDVSHVGESAFDKSTKSSYTRSATSEYHVSTELVVVFRVGVSDEFLDVFNDRVYDGFTSSLYTIGDVEIHGFPFD